MRRAIFPLALAGFAINALLLFRRLSGGAIAGCGGGSSCEIVLTSRWSQVLGIPVTVFGLAVFAGLMVSFIPRFRWLEAPSLGVLAGAAVWFVFVQLVLVGHLCPWCMAAHGIGVTVAILGFRRPATKTVFTAAAAAVLGLGLLQYCGPLPATHRIIESSGIHPAASVHARGNGRKVEFEGAGKTFDLQALPHLGRADAKRVLVEYFDYACPACQTMGGYLETLVSKHPSDVCVVTLPVPLERSCNHSLANGDTQHPGACELARLALAIWKTRPEGFPAIHRSLLEGASAADARERIRRFLPPAELDAALRDPWIDEVIHSNIADWVSFSEKTKQLPKLLITGKRILHGLPSGEADFIRVMERELGLTAR